MNDQVEGKTPRNRILIVDDQKDMVHCLYRALHGKGFDVETARDGDECVRMIRRFDPDLILLDLMMPKRSGILVLEFLRTEVKKPIPVIMMTACEGNRHRQYAEQLGVEEYLTKPFPILTMLNAVERVLA